MGFVHMTVNWQTGVLANNENRNRTLRENEHAVSNTFHSECMPPFCFFWSNGTSHTRLRSDLPLFSPSYTYAFVRYPLLVLSMANGLPRKIFSFGDVNQISLQLWTCRL